MGRGQVHQSTACSTPPPPPPPPAGVLVAYQTDMEEDVDYVQPFVLVVMDFVVMVLFCLECLILISAEGGR